MPYYILDPLADFGAGEFCFTDNTPDGIGTRWYRLAGGIPFATDYPTNVDEVLLQLGEDYRGLKLSSFIGNTSGMLVVSRQSADIIASGNVPRLERLPFVLLDHKGRVYSRDYVFLNPLERIECLNLQHSNVRRSKKGEIKEIIELVMDKTRELDLPDLFRLGEEPSVYLVSDFLVAALEQAGCTNFVFKPVRSQ